MTKFLLEGIFHQLKLTYMFMLVKENYEKGLMDEEDYKTYIHQSLVAFVENEEKGIEK